jgi:hypothetical protein
MALNTTRRGRVRAAFSTESMIRRFNRLGGDLLIGARVASGALGMKGAETLDV